MNIVKRIIRYGVISLALSFTAFLLYGVYVESPSEVRLQIADTPSKALAELLAIAEKGTPINPDPYAASSVSGVRSCIWGLCIWGQILPFAITPY